jgi:hypothetical protein
MSHRLTELLVNGGFESGALAPWTILNGTVAVTNTKKQHSGNFVVTLGPNSAIQQTVPTGLKEGNVYRFTGALADDLTTSSIDSPENPTTVVTLQFIDKNGAVLETETQTFNRLTLPEMNEGNYRNFTLIAEAPEDTKGAKVTVATAADGAVGIEGIVADDFSLIQENGD